MVSLTPRAFDLTVFHASLTRLRQSSTYVKIAIYLSRPNSQDANFFSVV